MTSLPVIPESVPTHDNTMVTAWEKCPRLYNIKHVHGLRAKGWNPALQFGSLIHEGLAKWYETGDELAVIEAMMDYEDFREPDDDYRTRGRALSTIKKYIDHYGDERRWFGEDIIMTETGFKLEDPETGFRWGGKIDLVVLYNGKPWVLDHKSTSRGGPSWWGQFERSRQMAGYVWAGSQLHGKPVEGVIINRLTIQKKDKPAELEFSRRPILYPQWKIDEFLEQGEEAYRNIARARDNESFPPNWDSCVGKYGKCDAFDVCNIPPSSRARALRQDFEEDPWDWMEV